MGKVDKVMLKLSLTLIFQNERVMNLLTFPLKLKNHREKI